MSAAGNAAEQAEIMTLWLNEKLAIKNSNNNNNSSINMSNTNKYTASPKKCPSMNNNNNSKEFNEVCKKVQAGQKVMIMMRGAPGSGKTTMARSLLQQVGLLDQYAMQDFVFSSDDYFVGQRGYQFNPSLLTDAHEWNKQRVRQQAAAGWSPIIVDNTNVMIWEMIPYVQLAVQHGYMLELLEPQTSWSKSASKLAQNNVHQVPKENIQRMLDRYERASVALLLRQLKETKYTVPLPQMRLQPPLPMLPAPELPQAESVNGNGQVDGFKLNANAKNWIPYEQNAPNYWAQLDEQKLQTPVAAGAGAVASTSGKNTLVDLLRDEQTTTAAAESTLDATNEPLQRHSINCPNEPTGFVMLRQMYPNKQLTGLWDLYVKCNGDVDWAVDILLKEDELNGDAAAAAADDEDALLLLPSEQFQCCCSNSNSNIMLQSSTVSAVSPANLSKCSAKPQRQPRSRRNAATTSAGSNLNKELQLQIENCFVLGDDQYSEHTRKIRDIRNGILDQPLPSMDTAAQQAAGSAADEDDEDSEDNDLVEMEIGETLIDQLSCKFPSEGNMVLLDQEISPVKVFVPRQLAKQLYMIVLEAKHHQLEEQRQQTLRDDEQFARLLKNPKYAECTESPSNVNELLDMELALSIYNSEQQAATEAMRQKPNDIATYLTKMKLCEKFPDIQVDTVHEIFAATENNYVKTIEILGSGIQSELTGAQLYEQALREKEKLNAEEKQEEQLPASAKIFSPRSSNNAKAQSPQLHEEAKSAALRDFEETRNLAAHHSQLRAECYLKAKQAIQHGNGSVALYYSEIAQLHKKKNDVLNHRAANCIMEVHKHTQNNPDLLDLHYLHTMEAVSCLDLFLDRHITVLRNCTRVYKHLFIITGRGLHSANGVSTIKKKVKARLAERRLRWQEVNPGLLRVKVFSASRHSKNF